MDRILHHLESMGNHCLLVFTGESSFQGCVGNAKWISSIHSITTGTRCFSFSGSKSKNSGTGGLGHSFVGGFRKGQQGYKQQGSSFFLGNKALGQLILILGKALDDAYFEGSQFKEAPRFFPSLFGVGFSGSKKGRATRLCPFFF